VPLRRHVVAPFCLSVKRDAVLSLPAAQRPARDTNFGLRRAGHIRPPSSRCKKGDLLLPHAHTLSRSLHATEIAHAAPAARRAAREPCALHDSTRRQYELDVGTSEERAVTYRRQRKNWGSLPIRESRSSAEPARQ
jgi:hypothetical protein